MAQPIAKTHQEQLKRLKENVENSRQFFDKNYDRFNQFRDFVFRSTLTDDDVTNLQDLQKPILEFNILEPYISRLCGEFSKQEPQIEVSASHNVPMPVDVQTVNVVDGIIRYVLDETRKDGHTYEIFKDLMSGGFSVFELCTDYENDMTFDQKFKVQRVYDPTMTGFDPMAQRADKSDGNFCFYLYPKYLKDFQNEYPDINIDEVSFIKNTGFSWSYRSQTNDKILLLCDYYEKKRKPVKIVKLANNITITEMQYKKMLQIFQERNLLAVPPKIIDSRIVQMVTIQRYTFIEDQVVSQETTDFKSLPLIFVDGNSIKLRNGKDGEVEQMTRPYLYHARDIQRLKNFAGQTLANELENMIQHKFKVAKESIPPEYKGAYEDIQHADVLIYNAFDSKNPEKPLPPPAEVIRTPIPPEVTNTFSLTDQMTQNILGSFDIQMGNLNKSQLSGLAIQESVSQSNATAMPFIVGYLQALTQVANVIVELIPKYYSTPRTIPVLNQEGRRSYQRINDPNHPQSVSLDYSDNALCVNVEAGVNFSIQKTRALQQIVAMMQSSPLFAQFMNTEGLPILLDNLEIRGIDQLKLLADAFVKKVQMQQAQAANQPNPAIMKLQQDGKKIQMTAQQNQAENQLEAAKIAQASRANDIAAAKIVLEAHQAGNENAVQIAKANAETYSKAVDIALKTGDQEHRHVLETTDQLHQHAHDALNLAHQINQSNQLQQPTGANQNG